MSVHSGRGDGRNPRGSGRRHTGRTLGAGVPSAPGDFPVAGEPAEAERFFGPGGFLAEGKTAGSPGATPTASGEAPGGGASAAEKEYQRAKDIVLRQLTASPRSRHQLEEKLQFKEVSSETAASVLDRLEELGLVDDRAFADMYVCSRAQSRKLAKSALRRELAQKGVDREIAETALEQREDEAEEQDARDLVRKKRRPAAGLSDRATRDKEMRRLASMLARRGYGPSVAFRIVREELDAVGESAGEFF